MRHCTVRTGFFDNVFFAALRLHIIAQFLHTVLQRNKNRATYLLHFDTFRTNPSDQMSFQKNGRVPSALQAVFLASNRGCEVKRAPPNRVGSRIFRTIFSKRSDRKEMEEKVEKGPPTDIAISTPVRRTSNGETKKVSYLHSFLHPEDPVAIPHATTVDTKLGFSH